MYTGWKGAPSRVIVNIVISSEQSVGFAIVGAKTNHEPSRWFWLWNFLTKSFSPESQFDQKVAFLLLI